MKWFIYIALTLPLTGCIFIPASDEEPYQEGQIASVQPGVTTRQEMLELFGLPQVSRKNSALWIYSDTRKLAYFISFPTAEAGWIYDYQFLVVEFDEDTIEKIELVENVSKCSYSGICLSEPRPPRYGIYEEKEKSEWTIVTSKGRDDQLAKGFQSVSNKCLVYIYLARRLTPSWGRVYVDSMEKRLIVDDTYLHYLTESGSHNIRASLDGWENEIADFGFICEAGEVVFVEVAKKPWLTGVKPEINVIDYDAGREAIMERHLILLP